MKLKKYLYKKVESTNNVALRLIKQGNQRGIILTDQQTKGKGQRKNKWISFCLLYTSPSPRDRG